jgi:DNA-binding LytR/AlgR family response regulator
VLNSYVIIDSTGMIQQEIITKPFFEDFLCLGIYNTHAAAVRGILVQKPQLVLFYFNNSIPLSLLLELYQYLETLPYVIAINEESANAYNALKLGISDYLLYPLDDTELHKSFLKFLRLHQHSEGNHKLCIKSSGDYQFIALKDIVYLKADNNTTDFYLENGQVISGFKTMKFYESQLPFYFFRIHHSYIVNLNYVNRINLSKNDCYLHGNEFRLSFSRTYKDQIDIIIKRIG